MKLSLQQKQKGFTLIELVVVIAIIAILAALSYPSFLSFIRRARLDNARAMMSDTALAMERHYGRYRTFCKEGTDCTPPDIAFISKNNNAAAPATDIVVTLDNDNYDFSIANVNANSFVLKGAPKAGLYSDDILTANQLILFYDSSVPAFVRCTNSGVGLYENAAKSDNPVALPDADGCEVMQ